MKNRPTKKSYLCVGFLLLLAAMILIIRLLVLFYPRPAEPVDTTAGERYLSSAEAVDIADAEDAIRRTQEVSAQEEFQTEDQAKQQEIEQALADGNLDYACREILFSGDSLVKAIEEFDVLDSSRFVAEVGAGASYLSRHLDDIVAANPKYLILHYGENAIEEEDHSAAFTERYADCIRTLQQALPDTVIYVDSIFPVEEHAYRTEPYLVRIDRYNDTLFQMAEELGVRYLDFTPMFQAFDQDYYDQDGIHMIQSFYSEQYLPHIVKEIYLETDEG